MRGHHYYGVARDFNHYYVGARYRANTSLITKDLERGKILRFSTAGFFVDEIAPSFPLRDIHQILICDERLFVTCSYDNMIAIFDGSDWNKWYPFGVPSQEPYDKNHFNSLAVLGSSLCVVAHNWGADSGNPSELLFFNLPNMCLVRRVSLGVCAHNVWSHCGELMTCSSAEGSLVSDRGRRVITGGFPRGVAYTKTEINVGISEFAKRPDRDLGEGWIKVYNYNWDLLRTLQISGQGMVTDIYTISNADADKIINNNKIDLVNCVTFC